MGSQKLFWASNLKLLRDRQKISQKELAERLGFGRSKYSAHENEITRNPPLEDLLEVSDYYKLAVDTLIKIDLTKVGELKLRELEAGNDVYISGGRIRVLSISINADNKENVEYVPLKAKAGYLTGFNDPQYIAELPKFSLPHLPENKTYRIFPTEGDSMLPIPENCLVIAEYVSDWNLLKGTKCIVIMKNEQSFLFKEVTLTGDKGLLLLHSLNPIYSDTEIFVGDVLEIWKYHSHITNVVPSSETMIEEVLRTVQQIKVDVKALRP